MKNNARLSRYIQSLREQRIQNNARWHALLQKYVNIILTQKTSDSTEMSVCVIDRDEIASVMLNLNSTDMKICDLIDKGKWIDV